MTNRPDSISNASGHGRCTLQSLMNSAEIVDTTSPKECSLQMSERTSWCPRAPGQSGKPCAQRCVESLHISGIENAELCLRTIQDLLCNIPGADHQTARNGDEAFACFVFDDLHKRKLWPEFQARTSSPTGVYWIPKHLAHCLRPATKAIGHPQDRGHCGWQPQRHVRQPGAPKLFCVRCLPHPR